MGGETFVYPSKCWQRTDTEPKISIQSSSYERFAFLPVSKNNILHCLEEAVNYTQASSSHPPKNTQKQTQTQMLVCEYRPTL